MEDDYWRPARRGEHYRIDAIATESEGIVYILVPR